jgi:ribosome-associated toxin RatA of RatAB toxin-antitoxin module
MVQHSEIVNAPFEKVWEQLLYKIENPGDFIPGVSDVEIIKKNENYVIRQMKITQEIGTLILKEKITFIPYKVRFLLLEHPTIEGYVDNDITLISENETEMTFTINWINKTNKTEINNFEMVKNAVIKTKNFIEKN